MIEKGKVTVQMFTLGNNQKSDPFEYEAMSDLHAVSVCEAAYERLGLFGKWYCETSNGFRFMLRS
jgi:hypothetical protein